MRTHTLAVHCTEGHDVAKHFALLFTETSAKLGLNVEDVFYNIVRVIRDQTKVRRYQKSAYILLTVLFSLGFDIFVGRRVNRGSTIHLTFVNE